jgi:hypothetical protein
MMLHPWPRLEGLVFGLHTLRFALDFLVLRGLFLFRLTTDFLFLFRLTTDFLFLFLLATDFFLGLRLIAFFLGLRLIGFLFLFLFLGLRLIGFLFLFLFLGLRLIAFFLGLRLPLEDFFFFLVTLRLLLEDFFFFFVTFLEPSPTCTYFNPDLENSDGLSYIFLYFPDEIVYVGFDLDLEDRGFLFLVGEPKSILLAESFDAKGVPVILVFFFSQGITIPGFFLVGFCFFSQGITIPGFFLVGFCFFS